MNKEFLQMQKLAGLITEGQYKARLNEEYNLQPIKSILSSNISPEEKMEEIGTYLTDTEEGQDLSNTNLGNPVDAWFDTNANAAKWLKQIERLINSPEKIKDISDELMENATNLNEMSEENLVSTLKENGFEVSSNPAWIVRNSETGDDYILYTESGDYISHKLDGDFPEGIKIMGEGADDWLEQFLETEK